MKVADRHQEPSAGGAKTAVPRIVAIQGLLWIGALCALAVILCLLSFVVSPADTDARISSPICAVVAIVIAIVTYRAIWRREWRCSLAATCIFALLGASWITIELYDRVEVAIWLIRHNRINAEEALFWGPRFAWRSLLPMYVLWTAFPQWQWTRTLKLQCQARDD